MLASSPDVVLVVHTLKWEDFNCKIFRSQKFSRLLFPIQGDKRNWFQEFISCLFCPTPGDGIVFELEKRSGWIFFIFSDKLKERILTTSSQFKDYEYRSRNFNCITENLKIYLILCFHCTDFPQQVKSQWMASISLESVQTAVLSIALAVTTRYMCNSWTLLIASQTRLRLRINAIFYGGLNYYSLQNSIRYYVCLNQNKVKTKLSINFSDGFIYLAFVPPRFVPPPNRQTCTISRQKFIQYVINYVKWHSKYFYSF